MVHFGSRWISQKYLRIWPDSKRARAWAGVFVHIRTENGLWLPHGHGYTAHLDKAWRLPFEEAVARISHCGPEKCGVFVLASGQPAPFCGRAR
jgi:hypothetical protein